MRLRHGKARTLLESLSGIEVLRALPPEEMEAVLPLLEPVRFPAGGTLMEEGAAGDAIYFILDGKAHVDQREKGRIGEIGPGGVVGEAALLASTPRSATVTAATAVSALRIVRPAFEQVIQASPVLRVALEKIIEDRRRGGPTEAVGPAAWTGAALRALEARYRGLTVWQAVMYGGLALWLALGLNERYDLVTHGGREVVFAVLELVAGLMVIQGACEAFIVGVERLGARLKWDGFISGTIGSLVSTLPEFFVIVFLVQVEPLAAYVTAAVTIFNNALVFSVYSFFLPKNPRGAYAMPRSLTIAGGQILIAGATISLIVGIVMLVFRVEGIKIALASTDLIVIGLSLMGIYAFYIIALVRYFAEGKDNEESMPPDPHRLGHNTSWGGILSVMALGTVGAYAGGESIGAFAGTALNQLGLPTIPTAAGLAFFAGISEYLIVFKSHRRGELGIALSNVFGGMTQVMFLLLPLAMILIGVFGLVTGDPRFVLPINAPTTLLMVLLFPLFYALHQHVELEGTLTVLDAVAMTGIYLLLLFFLFTTPG
jgi:hypothetical protein